MYRVLIKTSKAISLNNSDPNALHIVLGASTNPNRYSYIATRILAQQQFNVYPFGIRSGNIHGLTIQSELPNNQVVDTVTLYLNPEKQKEYINHIIELHPRRVIFNPGTVDNNSIETLSKEGIECIEACTMVMLRTGQY